MTLEQSDTTAGSRDAVDAMTAFPTVALPESTAELRQRVRQFLDSERRAGTVLGRPDSWLSGWDRGFSERLAEQGWVGMTLPTSYGGSGAGALARFVVIEELLAAGAPVSAHWVADRQAAPSILAHGTLAQKQEFLPAIAAGRCFFSIGMSERSSGSDLASVQTRATPTDDGWVLQGTKMWTGGAHVNDYAIVLARTDDGADHHDGLTQFIVDLRAPGVRVEPIRLLTGEHRFNAVYFEEVVVPHDRILGRQGDGWRQVLGELAVERSGPERYLSTLPLLIAAVEVLARSVTTTHHADVVGGLVARLVALRAMSLGVAAELQQGSSPDVQAAMVKDLGTRFEGDLVEQIRRIVPFTPDPSTIGTPAELLAFALCHTPGYTLRGGTNEILRGIITKEVTHR